jgi:nucleoside-diphosphate-sugar epimerase
MLYARGKAKAEEWLRHQFHDEHLQVVVLRPGLIWGPGSVWSEMVGQQLQHGTVLLLNGGRGVANLVYVDNLVRIILAVASHPAKNGSGFFNVADLNPVTWRDYYAGLATRLGYSADAVRLCADSRLKIRPQHLVEWALQQQSLLRMAKRLWKQLGAGTRVRIKAKLRPSPGPPEQGPGSPGPPPLSREHWALQNTLYPLPSSKIHRDYGPIELIQFPEALDRTASWLRYAGFAARTANTKAHASAAFV